MAIKIIAKNRRASFDYLLGDRFEAGLELLGTEVKSLRLGKVSLGESFVTIDSNFQAWIHNMTIPQYEFGNINNHEETRKRKLLLHKHEITKLHHVIKTQGSTLIPTIIYFKRSRVKLEISVAKGKQMHDKRNANQKKDIERKLQRGIYD